MKLPIQWGCCHFGPLQRFDRSQCLAFWSEEFWTNRLFTYDHSSYCVIKSVKIRSWLHFTSNLFWEFRSLSARKSDQTRLGIIFSGHYTPLVAFLVGCLRSYKQPFFGFSMCYSIVFYFVLWLCSSRICSTEGNSGKWIEKQVLWLVKNKFASEIHGTRFWKDVRKAFEIFGLPISV